MRVELPHAFLKFVLYLARIDLRAQIDIHEAEMHAFEIGEVSLRGRRLAQISVFPVRDHSDDFNVRADWLHVVDEPEALPDRISAREVFPGKALVDDSVFGRPHVLCSEGTPGEDRNTERSKVVRADLAENRLLLHRRSFEILTQDRILPSVALQKRHGGEPNRVDTGHGLEIDVEPLIERFGLFVGVSVERRIDPEGKKMIGGEPRPQAIEIAQSAN